MYPAMLQLEGHPVTLIGGGKVAYRKAKTFVACGAKVSVFAPSFDEGFGELKDKLYLSQTEVEVTQLSTYLEEAMVVVAATNDSVLNEAIGNYCVAHHKLCNIIDKPALSSFIVPANLRRGDLCISISTNGKSPSLTQKIKQELEGQYDESYEAYVALLGQIRDRVLVEVQEEAEKRSILKYIITLDLEALRAYEKSHFSQIGRASCRERVYVLV